ncbi:hypothetical protein HDU87_007554 [Geranomyces variabilis]|uniref:DUF985 domain-containing protein n=1 Tax=Geranomyces variabilis TaxID=109894 RepID=A0AAD5TPN2_9FUNG|nr:hypothetical protein HDU87_007554 [Geranomyces variabilis]
MITQMPLALPSADAVILALQLSPHPEGGHFRETNRTKGKGSADGRDLTTSIYYLMHKDERRSGTDISKLHRLRSTSETFYLHPSTASATVLEISGAGPHDATAKVVTLGWGLANNEVMQHTFTAGSWFGAVTNAQQPGEYTLIGCGCAPGFDEADFDVISKHPDVAEDLQKSFKSDPRVWPLLSRLL